MPLTVLYVTPARAPVTDSQIEQYLVISYAGAPQAVLRRIPDSYHFINLVAPAVFRGELEAFLAR